MNRTHKLFQTCIVICLAVVLVFSLAACGSSSASTSQPASTSTSAAAPASAAQPAETQTETKAESVQTEPVIFVVRSNNNAENKTDNEAVYQRVREESGIDFEVVVVPQDTWNEKINLMIASGDKWDVLNITESGGNWNQYYQKNALQPWDEYLQYMPNVAARLTEDALRGCTLADGTIYSLPRREYFSKQFVPAIRQDWLDALGMECPDTMAELEAYFQGVIDENLNGNDNEIPIITWFFMENQDLRPYYLGFYGDRYLDADGNIMPWYMHENCWLLLSELNKWYTNGWLYSEYQTASLQTGFDLIAADRIGGWTGPYNAGVGSSTTIRDNDPDSKVSWVSLGNFTDFPAGGSNAWGANPEYMPELVLNAASTNGEWAAKLLNWIFENQDNYMLCAFGLEGSTWEYTDASQKEYLLAPDYGDNYLAFYLLNEWYDDAVYPNKFISEDDWRSLQVKGLQDKINTMNVMDACDWFVPYDMTGTEAEFLAGDSDTTISEACAKIVTGEWGEAEWNNAVQSAWNTEGHIYSAVWTEQYHDFVG